MNLRCKLRHDWEEVWSIEAREAIYRVCARCDKIGYPEPPPTKVGYSYRSVLPERPQWMLSGEDSNLQ